jgi:phosphoglycolate phosphatase-like HAD superfamily hydrolase
MRKVRRHVLRRGLWTLDSQWRLSYAAFMPLPFSRDDLLALRPRHTTFVGVDSDGCVFDSMELKQKECFHPLIIEHWRLERISDLVRETAEFVNLYSRRRGQNRFTALLQTFDLLRERPEVREAGVAIPNLRSLRAFVASGSPLGNPSLEEAARPGDPELTSVLRWSRNVNTAIARLDYRVRPFAAACKALPLIRAHSDSICVSQTPAEALNREWRDHDLAQYVDAIASQELGTKAEQMRLASGGRYKPGRVLVLGDAPGDQEAAQACGALFYPILPAHEDESWERFCDESYGRFLDGTFAGDYEAAVAGEFETVLPSVPPWEGRPAA